VSLHYRLDGDDAAPVVLLSGSLGSALDMWDAQLPALAPSFRVLRYDHPGHGGSPVAEVEGIGGLARDVAELLDELGVGRVSACGLSLGGAVALRLALDAPERVDRLVLASTSARFGPPETWQERADTVRERGMEAVVGGVRERWFTPEFPDVRRFEETMLATDPEGYARCCEAIRDWDARDELGAMTAPTLVVSATHDPSTPPEHGEELAAGIRDASLLVVDGAAHLVNVQCPDVFNDALLAHLSG
jgi:3-oxoadipate enol-lactonase